MKKIITEKLILPLLQAIALSIVFGAIVFAVTLNYQYFFFSSMFVIFWFLCWNFTQKHKWFPKPLKQLNLTTSIAPIRNNLTVILTADNGKKGDYFCFKDFDLSKVKGMFKISIAFLCKNNKKIV